MVTLAAILAFAAAAGAAALPTTEALENSVKHPSAGGHATCTTGFMSVQAKSTQNEKFKLEIPKNQSQVTEFFLEWFTTGSTLTEKLAGPQSTVSGTYKIFSTLCIPNKASNASTLQFLTHGIGLTGSYWDFDKTYSYVDAAAQHGYASFYYDRLGTGKSSAPASAIQVVQAPLEVEIANNLITMLRKGAVGGHKFNKVVVGGQSFGSAISVGLAAEYPDNVDAVVLTGFSVNNTGMPLFLTNVGFTIANVNEPKKFSRFSNGYLVTNNKYTNQFAFFKEPGYAPAILDQATAGKGTATVGELLSLKAIVKPSKQFDGPVTVVNGLYDLPFCAGNCAYPVNKAAEVHKALFPKSKVFATHLAPLAGHALNFHYSAPAAYEFIQEFLKKNV